MTILVKKNWRIHNVSVAIATATFMGACYSNNCPLDNAVTCQYGFYDSEGTAIKYGDTITVSTLMPGIKTVYTYRKMGNRTITKDIQDPSLVEQGYTETISEQRKDTILLNSAYNVSGISLPMSYYRDRDTLVISYRSITAKDTIWIDHKAFPFVELPECGTYRFHTLNNISSTGAAIDHIEISNRDVNYDGKENVRIYFNGVAEEE